MNDGEIEVYAFGLDVPDWSALVGVLARDEIDRAERFRFARDRRRYVVGRARMRAILGEHLGHSPSELRFSYGPHGKPALPAQTLGFNLSRSHELGLLAVQRGAEVGVDVELLRPFPEALDIAQRFFAPEEYEQLASLPSSDLVATFFGYWTRKEAVVKSAGLGLSQPIDSPADRWVAPLRGLATNYVGAVASTVPPRSIRRRDWAQ